MEKKRLEKEGKYLDEEIRQIRNWSSVRNNVVDKYGKESCCLHSFNLHSLD